MEENTKKIRRKYEERKIWGKQDPLKLVRVRTRRARTYVRMYACTCLYLEAYARARKPSLKVDGYVCWLDESCRAFLRWSISNFANALATTSWRESAVSPITTLWPSNGGIFYDPSYRVALRKCQGIVCFHRFLCFAVTNWLRFSVCDVK